MRREALRKEYSEAEHQRIRLGAILQGEREKLAQVERDKAALSRIAPLVVEQERLEARRSEIQTALGEMNALARRLQTAEADLQKFRDEWREVTQRMDDRFRAAGYGDYCRPPYMRVRGHGLGITSDCPGDLTVDSEARLEAGMVFVMHPNQYIPETGYLMCGEPVVITPDGAKALSAKVAELDSVVA